MNRAVTLLRRSILLVDILLDFRLFKDVGKLAHRRRYLLRGLCRQRGVSLSCKGNRLTVAGDTFNHQVHGFRIFQLAYLYLNGLHRFIIDDIRKLVRIIRDKLADGIGIGSRFCEAKGAEGNLAIFVNSLGFNYILRTILQHEFKLTAVIFYIGANHSLGGSQRYFSRIEVLIRQSVRKGELGAILALFGAPLNLVRLYFGIFPDFIGGILQLRLFVKYGSCVGSDSLGADNLFYRLALIVRCDLYQIKANFGSRRPGDFLAVFTLPLLLGLVFHHFRLHGNGVGFVGAFAVVAELHGVFGFVPHTHVAADLRNHGGIVGNLSPAARQLLQGIQGAVLILNPGIEGHLYPPPPGTAQTGRPVNGDGQGRILNRSRIGLAVVIRFRVQIEAAACLCRHCAAGGVVVGSLPHNLLHYLAHFRRRIAILIREFQAGHQGVRNGKLGSILRHINQDVVNEFLVKVDNIRMHILIHILLGSGLHIGNLVAGGAVLGNNLGKADRDRYFIYGVDDGFALFFNFQAVPGIGPRGGFAAV